jgi:hypothetical protein
VEEKQEGGGVHSKVYQVELQSAAKLLAAASKAREQGMLISGLSRGSRSDDDDSNSGNCGNALRARQRRIKALVLDGKAFGETERTVRSLFVFMLYFSTVSYS